MDRASFVKVLGLVGGALAVAGGSAALVNGGNDTVVVGGFVTVAGGLLAIAGGAVARSMPGRAAFMLVASAVAVGIVAPGVIPSIADSIGVFLAYLAGVTLILVGAVLGFANRTGAAAKPLS